MVTGKKFQLYNGYTFGSGKELKSSLRRYGCTSNCGVYLYMTLDGKLAKPMSMHKHLPPTLYLLSDALGYHCDHFCSIVNSSYFNFLGGTFLWTKRGGKHPLLLLAGFTYSYQKQNADGRVSWYCSRRLKGCRASAISVGTAAYAYKPHDHPPPRLPGVSDVAPVNNAMLYNGENYTLKELFEKNLIEYDFKHQGSPHKPWVQEKIDEVIKELKMAKNSGQKHGENYTLKELFEKNLIEYDFQHQGSPHKPWVQEKIDEVIKELKMAKNSGQKHNPRYYYWMKKYDVMSTANEDYLIYKRSSPKDPIVLIVPREKYFDVLLETHKSLKHGGRDKMVHSLKKKYYIPIKAVEIFIALCPMCTRKKERGQSANKTLLQFEASFVNINQIRQVTKSK
ncbi:unnamed protein product, partial [Brenthis ino]